MVVILTVVDGAAGLHLTIITVVLDEAMAIIGIIIMAVDMVDMVFGPVLICGLVTSQGDLLVITIPLFVAIRNGFAIVNTSVIGSEFVTVNQALKLKGLLCHRIVLLVYFAYKPNTYRHMTNANTQMGN